MICLQTTEIIFFSNFSSILLIFLNEDFCIYLFIFLSLLKIMNLLTTSCNIGFILLILSHV